MNAIVKSVLFRDSARNPRDRKAHAIESKQKLNHDPDGISMLQQATNDVQVGCGPYVFALADLDSRLLMASGLVESENRVPTRLPARTLSRSPLKPRLNTRFSEGDDACQEIDQGNELMKEAPAGEEPPSAPAPSALIQLPLSVCPPPSLRRSIQPCATAN